MNKNGFITDLDMYMLEEACAFLKRLEKNGYADICISVNQSRILFYKADYLNEIQRIIHKYHCDPSRIILEVTEGITMDNLDEMKVLVRELHKMGFAVSMDDFGSGYSSLNILKELDSLGYSQNRGMKDQDLSPIQVLQNNKLPSILIEAGFLASENDRLYLIDDAKRKVFADKIADGIIKTLEDEKKSNSNP